MWSNCSAWPKHSRREALNFGKIECFEGTSLSGFAISSQAFLSVFEFAWALDRVLWYMCMLAWAHTRTRMGIAQLCRCETRPAPSAFPFCFFLFVDYLFQTVRPFFKFRMISLADCFMQYASCLAAFSILYWNCLIALPNRL